MRALPPNIVSLIHYVELNDARWCDEVVERLAIAMLWQLKKPAPMQQLRKGIYRQLLFDIKADELGSALNRLEKKEDIIPLGDGRYKLSLSKSQELKSSEEDAIILETKVKSDFCQKVKLLCPELDTQNIWDLFIEEFLIPLVTNEGAKAYDLLTGGRKNIPSLSYVDVFLERVTNIYRDKIRQVLYDFLAQDDEDIECYLLTYLDAYFLISASGLPAKVLQELSSINKEGLEFAIFVDTNFIYSILGLHDNPSNQAANDLQELVQTLAENIKIHFVVRKSTLDEMQESIRYHRNRLSSPSYPPNLAEAASTMDISGVYKTFFQRVQLAGKSINAEDYFMPYENNLLQILETKEVSLFPEKMFSKYEQTLEISEDIDNQIVYERDKHKERAKSEQKITHDVILWHFVQDQRGRKPVSPLQAKCWIVTVDYRYLGFDKFKSNRCGLLPACMHPSQLLQLLRFFVPRSPQLEKTLLGVMRFPIMSREFDPKAEQVSIRIVNHLSRHEGIEDIPVSTLTGVLADTILRARLSTPNISEKEEIEVIQNALAQIVAQKDVLLIKKTEEAVGLIEQVQELGALVTESEQRDKQRIDAISQVEAKQTQTEQQLRDVTTELQQTQRERNKYKTLFRSLIGLLIAVAGLSAIYILPSAINWSWVLQHSHKTGLQLGATICVIGIIWIIIDIDKTRKWFAFGTVVGGAVFAIIQII